MDGVAYTWDSNGNLLNDGERTFGYDHADRLVALSDQLSAFSFDYNGLGDRLRQTVDGAATAYTLDLNAGLTQVLADDSNTYLYGLDRIGGLDTSGWAYFLPDALGSVRQLTDPESELTASRAYEPFGSLLSSQGQAASSYGFAGEWADETGLINLRARYYSPEMGRFFQQDPWDGLVQQPSTLNAYSYALNNPILLTDPSGAKISCKDIISPWRSIFEFFGLCDPEAEHTLPHGKLDDLEALATFTNPFTVKCGVGFVQNGKICVPGGYLREPEDTCSIPIPLLQTSTFGQRRRREENRPPVVVQLQNGFVHIDSIPLDDLGDGVTVAQVLPALYQLRAHPSMLRNNRFNRAADNGLAKAVAWVGSQPPYGVPPGSKSFDFFPDYTDWRFDIVRYYGHHLKQ